MLYSCTYMARVGVEGFLPFDVTCQLLLKQVMDRAVITLMSLTVKTLRQHLKTFLFSLSFPGH